MQVNDDRLAVAENEAEERREQEWLTHVDADVNEPLAKSSRHGVEVSLRLVNDGQGNRRSGVETAEASPDKSPSVFARFTVLTR